MAVFPVCWHTHTHTTQSTTLRIWTLLKFHSCIKCKRNATFPAAQYCVFSRCVCYSLKLKGKFTQLKVCTTKSTALCRRKTRLEERRKFWAVYDVINSSFVFSFCTCFEFWKSTGWRKKKEKRRKEKKERSKEEKDDVKISYNFVGNIVRNIRFRMGCNEIKVGEARGWLNFGMCIVLAHRKIKAQKVCRWTANQSLNNVNHIEVQR